MKSKSGKKASNIGRPPIPHEDQIRRDGIYPRQWDWMKREAHIRGVPVAQVHREAIDWYISAIEQARSGSIATPEQDRHHEDAVAQQHNSNLNKGK